jgi:Cu/Ag efflux protein CusF
MARIFQVCLLAAVCVASALAQDGIQRGMVKKVDVDKGIITITSGGMDEEFAVTKQTRIINPADPAEPKGIREAGLKPGVQVMFKAAERDGKKVLIGLRIGVPDGPAKGKPGGDIRQAKIEKIDLDNMRLTLNVAGKEQEFVLTENTFVLDSPGKNLRQRLAPFKQGSAIFFKAVKRDGKDVIVAMKLAGDGLRVPGGPPPFVKVDSSKLKPLPELGTDKYQGFQGGLYPEGKNQRPKEHEAAGLRLAKEVLPRDADGKPNPQGKIVLLSIGMSNTSQASEGFSRNLAGFDDRNPAVVFVNGAQGGMTAFAIQNPDDQGPGTRYWTTVDARLEQAGVTRAQVQAAWIKQADAGPREGFPAYARKLQAELTKIVQALHERFPNLKLVYLSGRTYAGFATTPLNPEPYAYESGFSVKWLIEEQIKGNPDLNYDPQKGAVKAPWLSWGPYLWANGGKKNADGLYYEPGDFAKDGTHHSSAGVAKLGRNLLQFFRNETTTQPWFVRR